MPALSTPQLTFNFEPSLPERFNTLREFISYRVQEQRLHAASLAGKMDLSPSVLSRKLSQNEENGDKQRLTCDDMEHYIRATGDAQSVIEYLAAKYMDSEASRRTRALGRAETLIKELTGALAAMKETA